MNHCPADNELSVLFRTLFKTIRHRNFKAIHHFGHEHKLKFTHISLLHNLASRKQMTVGEIGQMLDVSNAAVSQMTDRLVKAGLIERREDPDDRRVKILTLSEMGEQLMADMNATSACWIEKLNRDLTEEERETITAGLKLLQEKLNDLSE